MIITCLKGKAVIVYKNRKSKNFTFRRRNITKNSKVNCILDQLWIKFMLKSYLKYNSKTCPPNYLTSSYKGQIVSKGLFGILGLFLQKTNEQIRFRTVRQKKMNSFVSWKNPRIPKVVSKLSDLYLLLNMCYYIIMHIQV